MRTNHRVVLRHEGQPALYWTGNNWTENADEACWFSSKTNAEESIRPFYLENRDNPPVGWTAEPVEMIA